MNSSTGGSRPRLAVIATHPVQYVAPWFAYLCSTERLKLKVFYLWDFGIEARMDRGFNMKLRWDIPLLEGYESEFIENRSRTPGTESFLGLWNPGLTRRVRAYRPDAVLLTAYNFASIAMLLARWRRNEAPLLLRGDSHRLIPRRGLLEPARRRLITAVFRRFAAVLYVGSANRDYFAMHGVAPECLFHCPHAVDQERFFANQASAAAEASTWKRSLGIPDEDQVVLFAGKFEENKRPLDLLHAFLAARLERASLLYVGSGPQEKQLRSAAAGKPNIFIAPFRNQSLMPQTYAMADVFVLPSSAESWGLAVNEAMCMGRPVIVSDHVGCARDLVIQEETGLTFAAGDVSALRQALRHALDDEARLKSWGKRAAEHIGSYSYENATAGLLAALRYLGVGPL